MPALPSASDTPLIQTVIGPLALASAAVSVVLAVGCLLVVPAAAVFAGSDVWRELVITAWKHDWPASVLWLLARPVEVSVAATLLCLLTAVSSWGLYRRWRWGLWSFVALLLAGIVVNFACAWWVDAGLAHLQTLLADAAEVQEVGQLRLLVGLVLYGGAVLLLFLQGWLAWRLWHPDVRRLFH